MSIEGRSSRRAGTRWVLMFVLASLGLLLVGDRIHPVASALSPIVSPIQAVVSGVADDIGATISSLRDLPRLQSEIDALRKQNAQLINQHVHDKQYQQENKDYSEILRFNDLNPHLAIQPASVIAWDTFGLSTAIGINVGADNGVRQFMPVLDPQGFLVGHIDRVWKRRSEVMLISDPNSSIGAMDLTTHARGLFETPPYGDTPRLDEVFTGQGIGVHDLVVTDRLQNLYPEGLVIGQVTAVHPSDVSSTESADVRTAANLTDLEHVQVVTGWNPGVPVCLLNIPSPNCRSSR